jgi:hypothetical protein
MNNITTPTGGCYGGLLYRVNGDNGANNDTFTTLLGHLYEWAIALTLSDGIVLHGTLNGTPCVDTGDVARYGRFYGEVATEDENGVLWGSLTAFNEETEAYDGPIIHFRWDDVIVLEVQ